MRFPFPGLVVALCLLVLAPAWATDAALHAQDAASPASLDSIFDDLDRTDRPGCAVSVTRDGRLETARGYGMANLEYGVPIEPASIFHVASVSKHVTAFAVQLLVAEGRVSWDDDVRDHVPEMPDYGQRITLDHLVHHTGGVRDQWELLIMAGWRWEADLVRQRDALELITRQPSLNFPPGTDWSYSNSGYTLLAAVVERVTGQSLADFAEERIFGPLGMDDTHFHDDHQRVVPDRAYAYAPSDDGGWKISIPDFAIVGATSLFTTVEDLARWERNFRTAEVGGRGVVDAMLHRIRVAGEEHPYAHGLGVGDHRGLETVGHGGADAGYRAHFVRYPDEGVAVSVLCNAPSAGPSDRARRVADVVLAGAFPEDATGSDDASTEGADDSGTLSAELPEGPSPDALVGWYASPVSDLPLRISHDGGEGFAVGVGNRAMQPLEARSDSVLEARGSSLRILVSSDAVSPVRAVRVADAAGEPRRYVRAEPADTDRRALEALTGRYRSDEVDTRYLVRLGEDGGLELRHRRHGTSSLSPMHRDAFSFRGDFLGLTFRRDRDGRVVGFTMSGPRTWKVRFRKVEDAPSPE